MRSDIARLALALGLLVFAGQAQAVDAWPDKLFNPAPIADDIILPMPCGGAMAFRKVDVPGTGILDDYQVKLGDPDQDRAFSEYAHADYIAAPFMGKGASRYYLLAKYETTKLQYDAVTADACPAANLLGRTPATEITWLEASNFAARYTDWLLANAADKLPIAGDAISFLRLPTEAEWEYAARGGVAVSATEFGARTFPMPDGLERYAWYGGSKSANNKLQLTGLLQPNPLGLHDLLGNADEFVWDAYRLNRVSRAHGRAGGYIVKGGNYLTSEQDMRSAYRSEIDPFTGKGQRRSKTTSFRLALSAPVLTNQRDITNARAAWDKLGSVGATPESDVGGDQPLDDPVQELAALAQKAEGNAALKSRLENLEQKVKSVLLSMQDQQGRAGRTLLRLGAWLGQQLHNDAIYTESLRQAFNERVSNAGGDTSAANPFRAPLETSESAVAANLKTYTDLVTRVGDDYDSELLTDQLAILKSEMTSAGVAHLVDYANVFMQHARQYATDKKTHSAEWLKDLVKVASQ